MKFETLLVPQIDFRKIIEPTRIRRPKAFFGVLPGRGTAEMHSM